MVLAPEGQTNFYLFSIFPLPFCHISGSCLSNQDFTVSEQIEGDRQGQNSRGEEWISPNLCSISRMEPSQALSLWDTARLFHGKSCPMLLNSLAQACFLVSWPCWRALRDCLFVWGFRFAEGCILHTVSFMIHAANQQWRLLPQEPPHSSLRQQLKKCQSFGLF